MQEPNILELVENMTDALAEIDIQVMDTRPFIRNFTRTYSSYEDLRKDLVKGKTSMFIEVEAIIHGGAWDETIYG